MYNIICITHNIMYIIHMILSNLILRYLICLATSLSIYLSIYRSILI